MNYSLAVSLFILFIISHVGLAKSWEDKNYHKFSETCMGTKFSIIIDDDDLSFSKRVAQEAFNEALRLDNILSDYLSESELSKISQNSGSAGFTQISDDLFNVLESAQSLSTETKGSFDITIGPLTRLWRIARFKKVLPSRNKLSSAQKRVGYKNVLLNPLNKEVRLLKEGMTLDLGGIAKGYAADQMLQICKINNLPRALIDAGGDILAGEAPRNKKGWLVEIGGRKHSCLPILTLSNIAIATSGDIEQSVTINNKTYSHLINPKTGIGLTSMAQITIVAPTAMEADSLASACLVLGLNETKKLLKSKNEVHAYLLDNNNNNVILHQIAGGP